MSFIKIKILERKAGPAWFVGVKFTRKNNTIEYEILSYNPDTQLYKRSKGNGNVAEAGFTYTYEEVCQNFGSGKWKQVKE